MPGVDGYQKEKPLLESCLESIVFEDIQEEKPYLIQKVCYIETVKNENPSFGLEPSFGLLMGKEEIIKYIYDELDDDGSKKLYEELFASDIPIEEVSRYANSVEIYIRSSLDRKEPVVFPIEKPEDLETVFNKVQKILHKRFDNRDVEFSAHLFKEHLDSAMIAKVISQFCK